MMINDGLVIIIMMVMLIVKVNIVGDTLQSIDEPEMLPLIADQSESQASSYYHFIKSFLFIRN